MKYAIKHLGQYYFDGSHRRDNYDNGPWVSISVVTAVKNEAGVYEMVERDNSHSPTVYESREDAAGIIRSWFNADGGRDHVPDANGMIKRPWFCTLGGAALGEHLRKVDDKTKKVYFEKNPGPFPEVVEVADDFGRHCWSWGLTRA
jgi:hypothetical protein